MQSQRWIRVGLGLLAVFAFAIFLFWPRPKTRSVSPQRLVDDPSLGPASALVTIFEYGDFGCPTCRAWHNAGIMDQIRIQYGDRVRFVWRDFPVITPQSPKAVEAAQCAYNQGKFGEYHDLLFARDPNLGVSNLHAYSSELELDQALFNQCLDSGKHQETVQHDWRDAKACGFLGTPYFLIDDRPLIGPPTAEFLE